MSDDDASVAFRAVSLIPTFLLSLFLTELFGVYLYLQFRDRSALESLTADGVTLGEVVDFLAAHSELYPVMGGLAVLALLLALAPSDGTGRPRSGGFGTGGFDDGDGFDDGGFDGGGGDGGDE